MNDCIYSSKCLHQLLDIAKVYGHPACIARQRRFRIQPDDFVSRGQRLADDKLTQPSGRSCNEDFHSCSEQLIEEVLKSSRMTFAVVRESRATETAR